MYQPRFICIPNDSVGLKARVSLHTGAPSLHVSRLLKKIVKSAEQILFEAIVGPLCMGRMAIQCAGAAGRWHCFLGAEVVVPAARNAVVLLLF